MQIYILLTDMCNLKCAMCIRGRQTGSTLQYNTIKNSTWIEELGDYDVVLTGGEPTITPDFIKIVKLFCTKAKTVTITTNGTINDYIENIDVESNLYFQISIDGDQHTHDLIRGKGTYEKSMRTVLLLEEHGIKYSIASVVNKNNRESFFNLEEELRNLANLRYWRLSYEMPFGSAGFDSMLSTDEWNSFVDKIIEKAQLKLKIKKLFPFDIYKKYKNQLDAIFVGNNSSMNCGSGKDKLYIYPDLQVYPCTCLTEFSLGSLKEKSLSDIMKSKDIEPFIHYNVVNKTCESCEYLKYCNGGCIGMSYHWYGKLGMGDKRCPKLATT